MKQFITAILALLVILGVFWFVQYQKTGDEAPDSAVLVPVPPVESAQACELTWLQVEAGRGAIVLAALYSLPATTVAFDHVREWAALSSHSPADIKTALSDEEISRVQERLVETICMMDDDQRHALLQRVDEWLLAHEQFSRAARMYATETVMDAAFAIPATRPLFEPALKARGLDIDAMAPMAVGGMLSSGELAAMEYGVLNVLSGMDPAARTRYWSAFFDWVRSM